MSPAASYGFASAAVIAIMIGQFLFKRAALALGTEPLARALSNREAVVCFALAAVLYGAATIAWVIALRHLPLSRAYMLMAAGFVMVPLVSHFMFGEALSPRFAIGALMIAAGVVLTNAS